MSNDSLPEPLKTGGGAGLHGDSVGQLYRFLKNLKLSVDALDLSAIEADIDALESAVAQLEIDVADLEALVAAIGTYAVPFQGQISVPATSTVDIVATGTWTSTGINGTFDSGIDYGVSQGVIDTFALKNTSGVERVALFTAGFSVDPFVGNNKEIGIALVLDGTVIDESIQKVFCKSGDEKSALFTSHIISVPANSEVAVWIANFTNGNDLEVHTGMLTCTRT